jgi:N-acyl-D-aspartate/D-glutamate deacylase
VGLIDRGALRPGFAANITIFDPASIADRATFNEPRRYPAGITHVIVTGVSALAPIATVARSHATPTAIGYRPNER